MHTIAVDAMGGDHAPTPEVAGAVAAVREAAVRVLLFGDQARLDAELARLGARGEANVIVRHAPEVVTMHDHPGQVFRKKRQSSLRLAFEAVKAGEAAAVVSAGNSGAMLSHALFVLGRLPGVERPGIVTVFPTPRGTLVLCDMGANVDVRPAMLAQFAILGACYDRAAHLHQRPRVGLLSNGSEESKGTELTRAAHALLRRVAEAPDAPFEFIGYVEGSDLFKAELDVVATDGFTGNIVLKTSEGVAEAVFRMVKRSLQASLRGRLGGALIRPAMRELKKTIDYAETGGALLAGVRGVVTLCHGKSDMNAIKNAIKASDRFVRADLVAKLGAAIAVHAGLWHGADDASSGEAPSVGDPPSAK